ncbi:transglycosylase SLT domain-containing protein [Streptomyces varsoviensis]|uniref:Lytic transglycosylase n=1 Tax=Streptomyces varsoviensis TaxID=67373 RepID=A0ABR5J7T5_9ACTN|nr:transglycosylase SLT domain-containing protein [Streptomyces varsoviensis]KOG89437.1 lytic transglycosylase [Streptomyces varsoviensis]
MPVPTIPGYSRLSKVHKFSVAGIAAAGVAAVTFAAVPGSAEANGDTQSIAVKPVAQDSTTFGTKAQQEALTKQSGSFAAQAKTEAHTKAAEAKQKAEADAKKTAGAAKAKADKERSGKAPANRSEKRAAAPAPKAPAPRHYGDNLEGWIRQSLDILHSQGIPGSYEGIKRNIMRESTGNPQAINNWDSNAVAGIPSKGLLQVIDPTFKQYHVAGTSWDIYDPVANITAACKYAADRYGSMDNVNSAY